jgi:hypothetical protein
LSRDRVVEPGPDSSDETGRVAGSATVLQLGQARGTTRADRHDYVEILE